MVLCDPLDRNEGIFEDETEKMDSVANKIKLLPTFDGDKLEVTMDSDKFEKLMNLFKKARVDLDKDKKTFMVKVGEIGKYKKSL